MAETIGSLKYDVNIDDKALNRQLAGTDSRMKNFGHSMARIGKTVAIGVAAATAAAAVFGVKAVKAFSESEDAIAQTNAVLKATKGVAGVSAKAVDDLSKSLQRVTRFSDEQVRSAQNVLLTFKAVHSNIFPRVTEAALDMAQALGLDLNSAMTQLGKAMQDPVKGAMALSKQGSLAKSELEHLRDMAASGSSVLEQQTYILEALEGQYKGSAKAAGETFAGKLDILKNSLNDVQETIGKVIVDRLVPLMTKIAEFVTRINWEEVINRTINAIKNWYNNVISLYQAIYNYLAPGVSRFIFILKELWHWIYGMLAPSIKSLADTFKDRLLPQLMKIWNTIEPGFTNALKVLGVIVGVTIVAALWLFINALNVAISVLGWVVRATTNVIKWIGNLVGVIVNATKETINWFSKWPTGIKKALSGIGDFITRPFKAAFDWIQRQIDRLLGAFDRLKNAAGSVTRAPGNIGSGIKNLFSKIPGFASGVTNFEGGLARVHRGEVLANLPKGTDVIPKSAAERLTGSNLTVNIGTIEDRQDADYILNRLNRGNLLESMGVSPPRY